MQAIYVMQFVLILFISACMQPSGLVKNSDVEPFMQPDKKLLKSKKNATENLLFWQNRLTKDTASYVNMMQLGYACLQQFSLKGEVDYLWRADSLFNRSNQITQGKEDVILLTMAQTAITTHRFSLAWDYVEAIAKIDHDPLSYNLVRFDAAMEMGYLVEANKCLDRLQKKDEFDYLIRMAKLKDHLGDLEGAIVCMEKALGKARQTKSDGQIEWALTNLSDMYGHNGEIKKALNGYKEVLALDPENQYALRGLGWIAFSHDKNTLIANRIYTHLNNLTQMPDHLLILGEIARYNGDETKAMRYFNEFAQRASAPNFGNMYNKYLIAQYSGNLNQPGLALTIANREIKNRFTPETVNWLAWANFKADQKQEATNLLFHPSNKQNHEPDALFHTAQMMLANGKRDDALTILDELKGSAFEVGPNIANQVEKFAEDHSNL